MKRVLSFGLIGFICFTASVHADILETKKGGIQNGQILSDDGKQLKFKDAKGKTHVYDKKDVLYQEKEDAAKKSKRFAHDAWDKIKAAPMAVKKGSDKLTEKFIGTVGKPLDRSAADAKGAALAKSMDEASQATGSMTKKSVAVNKEVYRQKNEAMVDAGSSSSAKKGHFASLDS